MQTFIKLENHIYSMANKKGAREITPTTNQLINSPEFKKAVGGAMKEIDAHSAIIREAQGLSEEEAKKKIAQMYYANMKWTQDPVQAAQHLLAQAMMGQQIKMELDPNSLLDTDEWTKILDAVRKTIKLVGDMQGKTVTHKVQGLDDEGLQGLKFIDVEE